MKHILIMNWDLVLLRGIIAILFGVAALVLPQVTVPVLVILFGAYTLVNGIVIAMMAIKDRTYESDWWVWLLAGLVSMAAGVVSFAWPGITAAILFYVIVAWAIVSGILEIVLAIQLRKVVKGEWLLALTGILSIVFGFLCIVQPAAGALTILWLLGIYPIVYGALQVALAVGLRSLADEIDHLFANHPAHTS